MVYYKTGRHIFFYDKAKGLAQVCTQKSSFQPISSMSYIQIPFVIRHYSPAFTDPDILAVMFYSKPFRCYKDISYASEQQLN